MRRSAWFVGLISVARFSIRNPERQDDARRISAVLSGDRQGRQSLSTQDHAPDRARLIYFSNTFLTCPTFFSTLPALCSALPSASKSGLVRDLTCRLFDFAFHFMKSAFDLIRRTRTHGFLLVVKNCLIKERAFVSRPGNSGSFAGPDAKLVFANGPAPSLKPP